PVTALLRRIARLAARARDRLGLYRRRRLGAILRARDGVHRTYSRRYRADTPDQRRISADDGQHADCASGERARGMEVGVRLPGARSAARSRCDATACQLPTPNAQLLKGRLVACID